MYGVIMSFLFFIAALLIASEENKYGELLMNENRFLGAVVILLIAMSMLSAILGLTCSNNRR